MNQSIVNFIHSSLRGQPPPIAKLLFDKKVLGFHFIHVMTYEIVRASRLNIH